MAASSPPSWMPHERYVDVAGARLYLRDVGSGTPIVVLHGGPDFNHHYLLPELDDLASAFRLIYYDQRGRGKSSQGVDPRDVTMESELEDLERLRHHLELDEVAVLGHSWGGLLAMEYAAQHPSHVSHLILMNCAAASHDDLLRVREHRKSAEPAALAVMREISATYAYIMGDPGAEALFYHAHFGATLGRRELLESLVARLRAHFTPEDILKARAIEDRLYDQTWRRPGYDVIPRLAPIHVPTLVIHGDRDLIPVACARRIAEGLPGACFVLLEDCGHFAYLERPAETFDAIEKFLG